MKTLSYIQKYVYWNIIISQVYFTNGKIAWKTDIRHVRDERVCSTETSGTALTPEHSSPHCVAEWGSERIQRASELIWTFKLSPWTPVPVRASVAATASVFGETGQGNGIRGSAYCSASLRSADCDQSRMSGFKKTFHIGRDSRGQIPRFIKTKAR